MIIFSKSIRKYLFNRSAWLKIKGILTSIQLTIGNLRLWIAATYIPHYIQDSANNPARDKLTKTLKKEFQKIINDFPETSIILMGDFNEVMNPINDRVQSNELNDLTPSRFQPSPTNPEKYLLKETRFYK